MATNFTYPGVYINERPSGLRAIPSAATSVALFIGMADQGPMRSPVRVQSLAEYQRAFGATSAGEMADQVSQFFINGGGDAYVLRIASGDQQASVRLRNEGGSTAVMRVVARDSGKAGNNLRVVIDYATSSPERTFNLTVFRSRQKSDGTFERTDTERFADLSMDPLATRYFPNQINGVSKLITAEDLGAGAGAVRGVSISGAVVRAGGSGLVDLRDAIVQSARAFTVSVGQLPPVKAVVDHNGIATGNVLDRIRDAITGAISSAHSIAVNITTQQVAFGGGSVLWIQSTNGPIVITPAASEDLASVLMLGEASGGLEIDNFAKVRPAPSGNFARLGSQTASLDAPWIERLDDFAKAVRNNLARFEIADPGSSTLGYNGNVAISGTGAGTMVSGAVPGVSSAVGSLNILRRALSEIALACSAAAGERWSVEVQGLRLAMRLRDEFNPASGADATFKTGTGTPIAAGYDLGAATKLMADGSNSTAYLLGNAGGGFQTGQVAGFDGIKPGLPEYQAAFDIAETAIEIVNMLVLPRADGQTDTDRRAIWGAASASAARQRAILFVDPLSTWNDIATAEAGASTIKAGVDTRHSVVFWPQVLVPTPTAPQGKPIDPSGSMAGLFARTDSRFGTWTAPAGLEATLTGVLGVSVQMNDPQNGRINPKALNAIRNYPSGITSWGARMMVGADDTGNMDDRYVNVRRMMLFIENSLYRGLRFATFKNNAEPLWASIRLAAGSFMNGLMLQDAFASRTKSQAYYVVCDETINPPDDVAKGIVKVLVGFAPNRPAEFVEVTVTQIVQQAAA